MFAHNGIRAKCFLRLQRRFVTDKLTEHRSTTGQLGVPKRKDAVSPYSFPSDPDALLVEGSKLSLGERWYQRFSVAFPFIALAAVLSIPLGLATFLSTAQSRKKKNEAPVPSQPRLWDAKPLPPLLKAKELGRLIHTKKPAIVVYFRHSQDNEKLNALNLLFVLLKEISDLKGSPVDVYRVNVKEEFPYFNPYLKEELRTSDETYLQLVIPSVPESNVMPILPPVSVASFVSQLSKLLGGFNVKFRKDEAYSRSLDKALTNYKRCLFDLKLEGKTEFIQGYSLQQLDTDCRKLLSTSKK